MNKKLKRMLCLAGLILFSGCLSMYAEEQGPVFSGDGFAVETVPWVHTSWRNEELEITFYATNSLAKPVKLELSPVITDVRTEKAEKTAGKYTVELAPGVSEEVSFTMPAKGLKPWSHWDPQLYTMDIAVKADGKDAGDLPQVRFGYREMWVEKGYFIINGKRVFLRGGNHSGRRNETEMDGALYANFNADTIRGNDDRPFNLSDEAGFYLFYKGDPGLTDEWKRFSYRFANSPSLVGFAGHYHGYYSGPHGHPLMVGGIITDEIKEQYKEEHPEYFEIPKQINEMYPDWLHAHYVRGIGGNFRSLMWDLNYSVPMQSQEEWMKIWGENKEQVEPFFPQEFALNRYGADQMRMDRRGGLSILIENAARFFGDESYRMFAEENVPTYLPESLENYPKNMAGESPLYYKTKSYVYGRVVPAWRTWGSAHMLMHVDGHPSRIRENSPLANVFRPVFAELYFYLGGPEDDFTDKDNAFYPGEEISKSGIILNDTETDQIVKVIWEVTDASGEVPKAGLFRKQRGETKISVEQGGVGFVPINITAPDVTGKSDFMLSAECIDKDGNVVRSDKLAYRVFPAKELEASVTPLLIDSKGNTAEMLKSEGVAFDILSCASNDIPESVKALENAALLIIGRESYPDAVALLGTKEAEAALRNGLNIVVLEQLNRSVMGLTLDQTHTRDAFVRDHYNPLTTGLDDQDFQNWRGESSLFPSYPSFDEDSLWYWHGYSYQGQYTSFRHRRAWYWSNKAMVATMNFEKPQFGNFKILIDAWYDLTGTPLVEFQVGKGRILFCQLDMTDHVCISPVAKIIMNRILKEYSKPVETELMPVGFMSAETGKLLEHLNMDSVKGISGNVILLTPKDIDALTAEQVKTLSEFIRKGGSALARIKTEAQAAKLPGKPMITVIEDAVWNPEFPEHPVFSGLGVSDLFLREPQVYPRITGFDGATESAVNKFGIAGVAKVGDGRLVVLQVAPDKFEDAGKSDFTGRAKVLRIYSSILTKLGGLSSVAPQLDLIGGWGMQHEWMPGFSDRVPRGAPKVRRSPLYERPAFDWDPDAHVSF